MFSLAFILPFIMFFCLFARARARARVCVCVCVCLFVCVFLCVCVLQELVEPFFQAFGRLASMINNFPYRVSSLHQSSLRSNDSWGGEGN